MVRNKLFSFFQFLYEWKGYYVTKLYRELQYFKKGVKEQYSRTRRSYSGDRGLKDYEPDKAIASHHVTRHNTPIHNILSTDPRLSISQKALATLPEDGNVIPKHVGATIYS
jgi:hypothetical protein